MSWQIELKEYIAKVLEMGFSEDEIRAVLRSVGWGDEQMEEGMMLALELARARRTYNALHQNMITGAARSLSLLASEERFPDAVKTAIPLFLALLLKRIEILKNAPRRVPRRRRWPLSIAAANLPHPLLLAAPSWRTSFKINSQLVVDRIFRKIEAVAIILGRLTLFPIALLGSLAAAFKSLVQAGAARLRLFKAEAVKIKSLTPELALALGKFPEHVAFFDIFKLAGRMFRTRRLRTFLTISGISVGIGTILFLVSFGYGLQNVLFERITTEEALLTLDVSPPADNAIVTIDDAMVGKMKEIDGVSGVSAMISLNGEMIIGESSAAGFIYAVDASYPRLAGIKTVAGELMDEKNPNAVIISSAAAKLLGWGDAPESALGKELRFNIAVPKGENGEVSTVSLADGYKIAGVIDDPFLVSAYFPIEKIKDQKLPPYSQLKVKVKDTNLLDPAREKILSMGLLVSMLSETVDQAKKVFNAVKIVLGLFGVITLVVSAIGMLNTMTIALLERTQEVGIMKAVGASNFDVWKLFLAEAVIMGFLGGVGGIAIGFASATAFNYGINALARAFGGQALNLFQAPIWFVITIVAFSSGIGIITGLWPARRAAHLDPLDALKYK